MINVVCAVIQDDDGRVMACQRSEHQSHAGKWEFPGGKVETGEDPRDALRREIREELGCEIEVGDRLPEVKHDYGDVAICLIPFVCRLGEGAEPVPHEHAAVRWLEEGDFPSLDWAEADIPIWRHWIGGQ
ncbi:(deoxy)nucleoside triphosphate pyrophosphohydrolase [Verrucomicrobiaceae bacterium N1E253]|uniref:8-oxo-dGTP diphosphatase n=2 Tax=Oceaniferula marina TaxID=2748318 RepID=A0A851GN11_9BACT|nr:(deoxy)nucleoside triphosphate pyrophosphohydrolase [Oceaniferula marina]